MPLEKWIRKGLLQIPAQGPTTTGLENHLATMCKTIEDYRPSVVVVDPITNLISVGTAISVKSMLAASYELRLYIAGTNLNSVRAIENVRRLCKHLRPSRCDLDIIDLYQQPGLAKRDDVVAAPALIKLAPLPRRTFVGDLSDFARVLAGLGITTAKQNVRNNSTEK